MHDIPGKAAGVRTGTVAGFLPREGALDREERPERTTVPVLNNVYGLQRKPCKLLSGRAA